MTANSTHYDWVKQVPLSLFQLDDKPLFGKSPAFPWEALSNELATTFHLPGLQIRPTNSQWTLPESLTSGLGGDLVTLGCAFSGLDGEFCWVMPREQIAFLMQLLLTKKADSFQKIDPYFIQGFYQFLAAQTLMSLSKTDLDPNLTATILDRADVPQQPSFCIDVAIITLTKTLHGRAILSQNFVQSWKERFADRTQGIDMHSSLAQKVQAAVHIVAGKTSLTHKELASVHPGDFILLDSCTLEPELDKGRVMLTVNGHALFRAKLKQGSLKILEYPLTLEAEAPMNDHDAEEEEDFEDFGEESDFEEIENEAAEEFEELEEAPSPTKTPQKPLVQAQAEQQAPSKQEGVDVAELPIAITIEIGRLNMSFSKLMELQPGNMVELDVHPEDGVDLVVNGRRIAKGELLRIGETLGVRILDIG